MTYIVVAAEGPKTRPPKTIKLRCLEQRRRGFCVLGKSQVAGYKSTKLSGTAGVRITVNPAATVLAVKSVQRLPTQFFEPRNKTT